MIKLKRFLPFLLAVALMLGLMVPVASAADTTGQITVSEAAGKPGDTVTVTVNLAKNPGIIAAVLEVGYDESRLKLVAVKDGALLADSTFSDSLARNPYVLSWNDALSSSNITTTGVLATLTFEILSDAKAGEAAVTVDFTPDNLFDWELNNVPFTATDGVVKVTAKGSSTVSGGGGGGAVTPSKDNNKADNIKADENADSKKDDDLPAGNLYKKYTDLADDGWYRSGVEYMLNNGYMNGVSSTAFDLDGAVTRAQFVTILYRYAGSPAVSGSSPFADVSSNAWYGKAVMWGAANGVVKGVSANRFDPDAPLTREQLATQLYRYDKAAALAVDHLKAYSDAAKISDYAKQAMNWAVGGKIINGITANVLAPQNTATRGQTAVLLSRYFTAASAVPVPQTPAESK